MRVFVDVAVVVVISDAMTFSALLRRCRKSFPTVRAFADALDVEPSHLSRAMGAGAQPFDVRGCLRLAKITGENPGLVLRSAGKADIAELIEQLYGPPAAVRLTPEEQQLLEAFQAIADPSVRRSMLEVARAAGGAVLVASRA
jgi:hypothetical protein